MRNSNGKNHYSLTLPPLFFSFFSLVLPWSSLPRSSPAPPRCPATFSFLEEKKKKKKKDSQRRRKKEIIIIMVVNMLKIKEEEEEDKKKN